MVKKQKIQQPKPNRQEWKITYVENRPEKHQIVISLPLDENPHLDDNNWLQVNGHYSINAANIHNIRISKQGHAYHDAYYDAKELKEAKHAN